MHIQAKRNFKWSMPGWRLIGIGSLIGFASTSILPASGFAMDNVQSHSEYATALLSSEGADKPQNAAVSNQEIEGRLRAQDISLSQKNSLESDIQCRLNYSLTPFPPFVENDAKTPSGFQVELIQWIADELGCHLDFQVMSWKESLAAIKDGKIDVVARASKTAEREEFAYFSKPYREELLVLTVRKGKTNTLGYKDLKILLNEGFILGVLDDGYFGAEIQQLIEHPDHARSVTKFEKESEILNALKLGIIDGFFEEPFLIDNVIFKQSVGIEVEEYPIAMRIGKVHFMFSKISVSKAFVDKFNHALKKVQCSQTYRQHVFWSSSRHANQLTQQECLHKEQ